MTPYFDDGQVTLYLGDCREVMWNLDLAHVGAVIADPPYGETSLKWDHWPEAWVDYVADNTVESCPLWCFGSLRMFLEHRDDFDGWRLAQEVIEDDIDDLVWEKHNGSGFAADRFKRVHELITHWYRGTWADQRHETPRVERVGPKVNGVRTARSRAAHTGDIGVQVYEDDGTRLQRSVLKVRSAHGHAIHPTQKPLGIIEPLLRYSLAPGGTVLDPFAGSCSTLVAAREAGYRAIGIEADEAMCAKAVEHRLAQGALALGGTT